MKSHPLFLAALLAWGAAQAVEEKKPPAPAKQLAAKADPKLLDEALQEYFSGHTQRSASLLYAYLEGTPSTEENYAWAQYFLAKSFIDLGLRHAAASYLARVARERANPNVVPKALEALRQLTDVPHDETMVDEQIFGALDLGRVNGDTGDFTNYQQGLLDLKANNERWAQAHFSKIADGTPEASKARFALLVARLRSMRDVPEDVVNDFLTLSKDDKLSLDTRNEGRLAVARLRFEKKDFKGALEAYDMVELPPLDPGRATLYLEEAWTRYHLGQLHAAMGLLTTLDAPSFREEFVPDKYILRALIFRDLCHYLPAKRAARELTRHFADSLEAIHERDDLTHDLRLRHAAEAHGATQRAQKFLHSLDLESERVGRYTGVFGDRLTSHVVKLYDLAHAEAQRVYEQRIRDAVRDEANRLLRAAEQVRLVDYEVGLKLYERQKKGAAVARVEENVPLTDSQVAFPFEGEYWNDELRTYRVNLKSRCVEEGGR
jgi:hypothetical protein